MIEKDFISVIKDKKIDFAHLAIKNSIISRISYENSKDDRNFDLDCFVINSTNEVDVSDEVLETIATQVSDLRELIIQ